MTPVDGLAYLALAAGLYFGIWIAGAVVAIVAAVVARGRQAWHSGHGRKHSTSG